MEYNIEKINQIDKLLAEVIEEAVTQTEVEDIRIGDVEMALRETLQAVGQSALKQFLENADGELETAIECGCGGKLHYQRRRAATIWSVFGRSCTKERIMQAAPVKRVTQPVDSRYGIEPGKVTAGLAHLVALSGIKESFDEGRKWLKEYLLFEVSENTVRSETQKWANCNVRRIKPWSKKCRTRKAFNNENGASLSYVTFCMARLTPPRCGLNPRSTGKSAGKPRNLARFEGGLLVRRRSGACAPAIHAPKGEGSTRKCGVACQKQNVLL